MSEKLFPACTDVKILDLEKSGESNRHGKKWGFQ